MQRRGIACAVALGVAGVLSMSSVASATLIISDDFNAPGAGSATGFALNTAVNKGIDPPNGITRLTGTAAPGLRWMNRTPTQKPDTVYRLDGDTRLRVNIGSQSGRISLSPDGVDAADFGPALGTDLASPGTKLEYDVRISMDNNTTGTQRMSFGWATTETSAASWDFGIQLYKAVGTDTTYTVQKRIDSASTGVADIDAPIGGIANAANSEVAFLIRVNDAGAESGTDYNSQVRVSIDDGATWIYDTALDGALPNGFRFDGAGRFLSLDIAGNATAFTLYDNLSINLTTAAPEPCSLGLVGAAGMMLLGGRRRK
jgi:hypothetical protein